MLYDNELVSLEYGKRYYCKTCGKLFKSDIQTKEIKRKDLTDEIRNDIKIVDIKTEYCPECEPPIVSYLEDKNVLIIKARNPDFVIGEFIKAYSENFGKLVEDINDSTFHVECTKKKFSEDGKHCKFYLSTWQRSRYGEVWDRHEYTIEVDKKGKYWELKTRSHMGRSLW